MPAEPRVRVHQDILVAAENGQSVTLPVGIYHFEEDGASVVLTPPGGAAGPTVRVPGQVLNHWLAEHHLGLLRW
jgi:hypothetical protein